MLLHRAQSQRAAPRSVEAPDGGRGERDGRVAVKALLAASASAAVAADVVVAQYMACVHEGRLKRKPAYFWGSAARPYAPVLPVLF